MHHTLPNKTIHNKCHREAENTIHPIYGFAVKRLLFSKKGWRGKIREIRNWSHWLRKMRICHNIKFQPWHFEVILYNIIYMTLCVYSLCRVGLWGVQPWPVHAVDSYYVLLYFTFHLLLFADICPGCRVSYILLCMVTHLILYLFHDICKWVLIFSLPHGSYGDISADPRGVILTLFLLSLTLQMFWDLGGAWRTRPYYTIHSLHLQAHSLQRHSSTPTVQPCRS